jgi:hypothetical protein
VTIVFLCNLLLRNQNVITASIVKSATQKGMGGYNQEREKDGMRHLPYSYPPSRGNGRDGQKARTKDEMEKKRKEKRERSGQINPLSEVKASAVDQRLMR